MRFCIRFLFLSVMFFQLAACSSQSPKPLEGQALYTDHPWVENARIWVKPGFSVDQLARYSAIDVESVEVDRVEGEYANVTPAELKMIQTFFPAMLQQVLTPQTNSKKEPLQGKKIKLKVILLEASRAEPEKSALDYIPFRLVMDLGKDAYNSYAGLEETVFKAAFRLNGYDANTDELLFSLEERMSGEPYTSEAGSKEFVEIQRLLESWAERLHVNYEKALRQARMVEER
ncbi:DUF3313 family protein [Neptuniibacter caesariensis]|uniref:DUF3313 domain-containing protein n=1 Tax=Neptuniibacter caesariensis TaxID=207954 RepID=A0A7U8GTA5_NEPCE|nr:DUF3313 family protein [Neptuniibacter caesariensis]EAR62231.1 hypothetical protein MED92_14378 [Oceanospirillum sp. MED92] [Neptuniibacter caesariensis]